jgi:DNA repair exonuclease SbcCD nuclease subunit
VTRLLAFGDLHLGAGTALGREPGDRLRDQEQVLDLIREAALEHDVDAILDAGDTFEGPQVTPEQLAVFARFVDDSRAAGFPVVAISGNGKHDAAMRHVNGVDIFQHVPGVTVYSRPGLYDLGGCQVACLPWVSPARLVASVGGDVDRDRVNACAAELLVQVAAVLADPTIKPTVLMLHGSISGASLPTGISTDDLREPVIPVDDLLDLGYACVVAGHIHVPQWAGVGIGPADGVWSVPESVLTPESFVVYTGSPMPLNFGETDSLHGLWILDVGGPETSAEFVPIESRPIVQIDVDDPDSWDDVAGAIVKARVAGTRTELRNLDLAAIRSDLLESGAHTVKIETETIREDRARVAGVTEDLEPLEAFDAWAVANEIDAPDAREQMQADLEAVGA